jgi:hypothetical protein
MGVRTRGAWDASPMLFVESLRRQGPEAQASSPELNAVGHV